MDAHAVISVLKHSVQWFGEEPLGTGREPYPINGNNLKTKQGFALTKVLNGLIDRGVTSVEVFIY